MKTKELQLQKTLQSTLSNMLIFIMKNNYEFISSNQTVDCILYKETINYYTVVTVNAKNAKGDVVILKSKYGNNGIDSTNYSSAVKVLNY